MLLDRESPKPLGANVEVAGGFGQAQEKQERDQANKTEHNHLGFNISQTPEGPCQTKLPAFDLPGKVVLSC
jgi:hypothetical protein